LIKEFLLSYDESYILEVDVEGMIVWRKRNMASIRKMEENNVRNFCLKDGKGAKQRILLWSRGGNVLFLKLLSIFPSPNDRNS
jgi:hypothetical protein